MDPDITALDEAVDQLAQVLVAKSDAFAVGWLKSVLQQVSTSSEVKLSRRQVQGLKAMIEKNIEWASR